MNKEKIEKSEKSGYEEYQEKLELINEVADKLNKEFSLEGENRVSSTPDQFVTPIIHKDSKRVKYVIGTFKSETQNDLKTMLQFEKDEGPEWFSASRVIRSLLKYGSEFNSGESKLIKKCLEKMKKEKNNN